MSEALGATAVDVVVPLAVAVLTALVSVQLALRRFRAERWWERKAEAYTSILGALFDVQRSLRAETARIEEGREISQAYRDSLTEQARHGYSEIRLASVLGTFLFSAEAAARLATLVDEIDEQGYSLDPLERLFAELRSANGALEDLKTLAKDDLSVRR